MIRSFSEDKTQIFPYSIKNMYGSCSAYLSLIETRKSLGVEEKSSKLAMSNCFTWMGSQSSMMNLSENEKQSFKKWLQEEMK